MAPIHTMLSLVAALDVMDGECGLEPWLAGLGRPTDDRENGDPNDGGEPNDWDGGEGGDD